MTDSHQRHNPGPGNPLTAQRKHYFRLMKQGLTNSEACRLVGISRSTGQHWRHGRHLRNKGREVLLPAHHLAGAASVGEVLVRG